MKRFLSVFLVLLIIPFALFGCDNEPEKIDPTIIKDGVFSVGMLLPDKEDIYQNYENGFLYANSLADYVTINNEEVYNNLTVIKYTPDNVVLNAQNLIEQGVSVIVFCGEDINAFNDFTDCIKDTDIPVISLSPYTCDYKRFYSLPLSAEYQASCAATYASDRGYINGVVLCDSNEKYYSNLAEVYKNTFKTYIGTEPAIYYQNGDSTNYNASSLAGGNYDYLFLICPSENIIKTVNDLRSNGFDGEIMLNEVFDHTVTNFSSLNNCSFLTKFENDPSNNISTVFYSQFSEETGTHQKSITSATAYGYDAYMTIFDALKSFSRDDTNSIFKNEVSTSTVSDEQSEITLSEFTNALENVVYHGVTGTIKFKDNVAVPTYIYVDNIINSEITLSNKYTFSEKQ